MWRLFVCSAIPRIGFVSEQQAWSSVVLLRTADIICQSTMTSSNSISNGDDALDVTALISCCIRQISVLAWCALTAGSSANGATKLLGYEQSSQDLGANDPIVSWCWQIARPIMNSLFGILLAARTRSLSLIPENTSLKLERVLTEHYNVRYDEE